MTEPFSNELRPSALRTVILERGEDYAIHRVMAADTPGGEERRVSEFTRIGNALHYVDPETGEWKESENLIEMQPDGGAAALRGPHKAFFAASLDAPALFRVAMSNGATYGGRVRSLNAVDTVTGERRELGRVRTGVVGRLARPNQLHYRAAFDTIAADVVLVWCHDRFAQEILLRECPSLPEGWNEATTRLEVLTEFEVDTEPEVKRSAAGEGDSSEASDDLMIHLGGMALIPGGAFAMEAGDEMTGEGRDRMKQVRKRWESRGPNRYALFESIDWQEVSAFWKSVREENAGVQRRTEAEAALSGPAYVIDFIIVPESQVNRFPLGVTFYVQSSYHVTSAATFEKGTVIKFAQDAHLRLSGEMTYPQTRPYAIFTSRNDDLVGEWIGGIRDEDDSDGDPTRHRASDALFVYFQAGNNAVRNVRVRWAQTCVRYEGSATGIHHLFADSLLEHSDTGIRAGVPDSSEVVVRNVRAWAVTTPMAGGAFASFSTVQGVMANASNWPFHQAEPAIAVREQFRGDIYSTKVVIVALSRTPTGADQGMVRMISNDGGLTWSNRGYIATGNDGSDLPRADGDADPSLVYDSFNNLFLAYRAFGSDGVVCAISEDDGWTWRTVDGFDGRGFIGATPKVAVGRKAYDPRGSLWITLHRDGGQELRCAATEVRGFGWANVGGASKWILSEPLIANARFHNLIVGPSGEVIVVATQGTPPTSGDAPVTFFTFRNAAGYPSPEFEALSEFVVPDMGYTELYLAFIDPIPVLAWDRRRNVLYLAYTSRVPGTENQDTMVVVRRFDESAAAWSYEVPVDPTAIKSQFHPWLTVDERSGQVAVIWYDTRDFEDTSQAYPYIAHSRNGFLPTGQPPSVFRLSDTPCSMARSRYSLKEYIGLTSHEGFLYPAFLHHGSAADQEAWDIFTGRLPL